jgi:predicted Zn-dependent protease
LDRVGRIRLQRWRAIDGPLVVHVPRPPFENGIDPVALQQAAILGVRAWNNQPFPILVDTRGDRNPHFAISWKGTLSGMQIGVARTQWSPETGLTVVSIELAMRNPYDPTRMNEPRQVRLTAAHEMGHALGLGHSDSERDVMYPTNTASAVSARDRRTMEALYEMTDGTEISR